MPDLSVLRSDHHVAYFIRGYNGELSAVAGVKFVVGVVVQINTHPILQGVVTVSLSPCNLVHI